MEMTLKPGTRLFSGVCTAEFIVVKAPARGVDLTIGGCSPVSNASDRDVSGGASAGHDAGVSIGKRYVDELEVVELLCTKPGDGVPAVDGRPLLAKEAKALPASD
jgi:hypothetical protein